MFCPNHTSLRKISNGGLLSTPLLFIRPINTVSKQMDAKTMSNGNGCTLKLVLNVYFASAQLPANDNKIPVAHASAPRKKILQGSNHQNLPSAGAQGS